jgi:hypothetical protein
VPGVGRLERVDARDEQVLFETLFEIKRDIGRVLRLLEGDDDEQEEEDES